MERKEEKKGRGEILYVRTRVSSIPSQYTLRFQKHACASVRERAALRENATMNVITRARKEYIHFDGGEGGGK